MGNLKRNNGSVTEKAHLNTDKKKFDEGWARIFGKKDESICEDCGETMTKLTDEYYCPKCKGEEDEQGK